MTEIDISCDLHSRINEQIGYYFSDFNLRRDKFLKEQTSKSDGWVPLSTLLTFNRLKALTEDPSVVIEALKSGKSELIEINDDGTQIRRSPEKPVPDVTDEYKNELPKRTVHIKGFPNDSNFDDLYKFCKGLGDIESLLMRRFRNHRFKGCVWAVYRNGAVAQKVIESASKYNNMELLYETREQQFSRKKQKGEMKEKRKKKKRPRSEEESPKKKMKLNNESMEEAKEVKVKEVLEEVREEIKEVNEELKEVENKENENTEKNEKNEENEENEENEAKEAKEEIKE